MISFPSAHESLQDQPSWGLVSPPVIPSRFQPMYTDRRNRDYTVSRHDLLQTTINQRESNVGNSPFSRQQPGSSQPKSVKHLTCWYWANASKGCKLPDDECFYSHFDTGRLAEPPVKIQRGCKHFPYCPSLDMGFLSKPHLEEFDVTLTPR